MKGIYLVIVFLFFVGCSRQIVHTKEYKIAIEELAYNEKKENLKLIPKEEIRKHKTLILNNDTIGIKNDSKTFAIKNIGKDKIFIYQFNKTGIYKRIECDSSWRVRTINYIGEVY